MLRYLLISALIVLGVAVLATAWSHHAGIRGKISGADVRASGKGGGAGFSEGGNDVPVRGDAPWALSALPECLIQTSESHGPRGYVLKHVPAGSVPIAAPATLVYGDCTISLIDDEAYVRRGGDRLRIPPRVRFYRAGGALVLLRESAVRTELRVYRPAALKTK